MKKIQYLFSALLFTATIAACTEAEMYENTHVYHPTTAVGRQLAENCPVVAHMYADTTFLLAVGVEQIDLAFEKSNGYPTRIYLTRIDLKQPGVKLSVSMPYDTDATANFQKQTLSDMATYADRPGHRVVAMINADFWDTGNMDIRGPIHRGGRILKNTFIYKATLPQQALSFVAVDDEGMPLIADSAAYRAAAPRLDEVTGGGVIMLRNGQLSGLNYPGNDPRSALGYTEDGVVYFLIVDGRNQYWSNGMTYSDMGAVFQALGCKMAVNFDGGGSAQLLIRHPYAGIFELHNQASDGSERAVVNGWMVTVDEP